MARALYLSVFIFASILVLYLVFGLPHEPESESEPDTPAKSSPASTTSSKNTPEIQQEAAPEFVADHQQCTDLQKNIDRVTRHYFDDERLSSFLDDGFSVDDITLAIDALRNPNFAREWRDDYRKKDSQLDSLNRQLNKALRENMPDLPSGMGVFRSVPVNRLEEAVKNDKPLETLSDEETLIVDDVAWLIQQPNLSDTAIKPFVLQLEDINAKLGSSFVIDKQAISLLDVAAFNRRPALAQWLMAQGARPTSDAYLGTTLDYALAGLSRFSQETLQEQNDTVAAQIALANDLIEHGQRSVSVFENDSFKSRFSANLFIFWEGVSEALELNYGFDLKTVPIMSPLTSPRATELITQIQSHQEAMITDQVGEKTAEKRSRCRSFKKQVADAWSPKWLGSELVDYRDDELYEMAPELVKCRREKMMFKDALPGRRSEFDEDRYYRVLSDGEWQLAMSMLDDYPEAVPRVFHESVAYIPESYAAFVGAGFVPDVWNFSYLEDNRYFVNNLQKIEDAGVDLHMTDIYGRNLLFIAVNAGSPDTLQYLVQSGVPYYQVPNTPDPLYLALYHIATRDRAEDANAIISILMAYSPTVSDAHLAQMRVMKLKAPSLYRDIVDEHPLLTVDDSNVAYPAYTCF
ncbi:hypothetical protein [Alteromonas sp. H39]|uniref:hypothetical protein n=1 Tax=Alteromonas sp. H39 TaxID=3389876 RepID=UPI0039E0EAF8